MSSSPSSSTRTNARGLAAPPSGILEAAGRLRELAEGGIPAAVLCDPTVDGVLCAVGCAYMAGRAGRSARFARAEGYQPMIGEVGVRCPLDDEGGDAAFALRVFRGYASAVGLGDGTDCRSERLSGPQRTLLGHLAYACSSDREDMPETVARYVRLGFERGPASREMIADGRVAAFDSLVRFASAECEHARQFVRFSRVRDGSLAASFLPRANVLPLVGGHFAARLRDERFLVVDPQHRVAILHPKGERACGAVHLDGPLASELLAASKDHADGERYVQAMWKSFYDALELEGRGPESRGYDLRAHWMRKRFWSDLPELDPRLDDPGDVVPAAYAGVLAGSALPRGGERLLP